MAEQGRTRDEPRRLPQPALIALGTVVGALALAGGGPAGSPIVIVLALWGLAGIARAVRAGEADWFEFVWPGGLLVGLIALAALALVYHGAASQNEAERAARLNDLNQIGVAMQAYRDDHGGAFPPRLLSLYSNYTDALELFQWPEQWQVYVPPTGELDRRDAIVYGWPPWRGGSPVLYESGRAEWVKLNERGELVNPRTGAVLCRATD